MKEIDIKTFEKRTILIKEFEDEFKKIYYSDTPTINDFLQFLDCNDYKIFKE